MVGVGGGNTAPVKAFDGWSMYSIQLLWAIARSSVNSGDQQLAIDKLVLTRRCYAGVKALDTLEFIPCVACQCGGRTNRNVPMAAKMAMPRVEMKFAMMSS